jgi:K(+)-stimulated pyrophosphate-energized sodium pump
MKSKQQTVAQRSAHRLFISLGLGLLTTASAFAAEGENVRLKFGSQDQLILLISALLGVVGVIVAMMMAKKIQTEDRGSEGMQFVQTAIEDGARAYLSQQIKMMAPFIVVLIVALSALYYKGMGISAALVGAAFLVGVISSYVSGFAGMIMAVNANARVAAAAMTSNKRALEIAFRSGSVAGLVTIGVGLFFASLILLLLPAQATTLLVGYGFGGSLAALFMRVGGGIYTKAADVGADLVGKVEAGIPEDSPMNPATIADNVGDNVGDCAGMAADVFESYVVMLVATIVLGAATSTVLDGNTWPKLIVFALAACSVGIVASIVGIAGVKGNDDLDSDPLKPILGGFRLTALISAIGAFLLSFLLLNNISIREILTQSSAQTKVMATVKQVQSEIAKAKKTDESKVTEKEVLDDVRVKSLGLLASDKDDEANVKQLLATPGAGIKMPKGLAGYKQVTADEIKSKAFPALNYAVTRGFDEKDFQTNRYTTVAERFGVKYVAVKLEANITMPGQQGQPAQTSKQTIWLGPGEPAKIDEQLKKGVEAIKAQKGSADIKTLDTKPVDLYYSPSEDKFALVAAPGVDRPDKFQGGESITFFRKSVEEMKAADAAKEKDPMAPAPAAVQIDNGAAVETVKVPWYKFALAVVFGIIMAIMVEFLTNYYVSASKRPCKEVAGVATAGPAPMIISGFAYGLESSVFMVLAIVVALLVPLNLFPPAEYGSMIMAFYGIALVGLGLLTTTAYILAMDTFGPISDNAQGVFEMSGESHNEYGSTSLQRLDAAGNTTKALTKGFAITTAVVAAVALFQSFVESSHLEVQGLRLDVPEVFLGLLIGAAAPFLFSSFAINAVGRAAFELISEVRRQFREMPGILKGETKPDYARCVAIVTAAAQRELLGPGILAIFLPIAVAFGFGIGKAPVMVGEVEYNLSGAMALGGFLAGAIASGQLMAVLLANSGGMWDNAKKVIEDGLHGGKGTEAHKAAVVCDTVGDPFKDTAGPALNPLIKVMNLVALLIVGVVIQPWTSGIVAGGAVTLVSIAALVFAFMRSKKGSLADQLEHMND